MNEPLKDKSLHTLQGDFIDFQLFKKSDIKSACEWLKDEMNSLSSKLTKKQYELQFWNIISKAFEDVNK